MKWIVVCLVVVCSTNRGWSQTDHLEFSGLAGNRSAGVTMAGYRTFSISDWDWIRVSAGIRLGWWHSQGNAFTSAPSDFADAAMSDTVVVGQANLASVSLMVGVESMAWKNWSVGFNIDLAGVTVGNATGVTYRSEPVKASPSPWNLLLGGTNDRGTLNSAFYLRKTLNAHWTVNVGFNHHFAELTTAETLQKGNTRFREISNPLLVSVAYRF